MAMILYGGPISPFVARVALAATFKGLKFERIEPPNGSKSPEYLAINPFGKVPAIKDGATTLYESSVIVEYLEAKHKTKKLVPKAAKAAALARLIGAVGADYVQPNIGKLFQHLKADEDSQNAIAAILTDLNKALDVLEKLMPKGKYACGSRFSIADVYVAPALNFAALMIGQLGLDDPIARRPKLKRYLAAIQKDKAARDVLGTMTKAWHAFMGG
jgi:glutathione S-transferase